jgi:hypothetical protein
MMQGGLFCIHDMRTRLPTQSVHEMDGEHPIKENGKGEENLRHKSETISKRGGEKHLKETRLFTAITGGLLESRNKIP